MNVFRGNFEWWEPKNKENQRKHGVSFEIAMRVWDDPKMIIALDRKHSSAREKRLIAIGRPFIHSGGESNQVLTVRFTNRERVRIFGAGYWRKGKKVYEQKNL